MALLNYLTDEEVNLVMQKGVNCPNAESLGDQLRYGIIELAKEGYQFKGVKVEKGQVITTKAVSACGSIGSNAKNLLDSVLGI